MPITIVCDKDIAYTTVAGTPTTGTVTWTAPRNGTLLYIDLKFYETKENLRVTVTSDMEGNPNFITYGTGSLEYIALHNTERRIYCDKTFEKDSTITVTGSNYDTDPEGTHRMRVDLTIELE